MKRFVCFFLIFVFLLTALPLAASAKELKTVTLNVYNWGQYIADGEDDLPDTNELFEEYFNENLAEKYGYTYVDLYSPLYDVSIGEVYEGYTVDGGHFTHEGYTVLTNEITPVLQKILGK